MKNRACYLVLSALWLAVTAPAQLYSPAAAGDYLYEADFGSGNIHSFLTGGNKNTIASDLGAPSGVVFDKNGNLYCSDAAHGQIHKLNTNGSVSVFAQGLHSPAGLAFDGHGILFVADAGSGKINKITANGIFPFVTGLLRPTMLAFDRQGNLFVTDNGTGDIYKVAPTGAKTLFANKLGDVQGLAFDAQGNLYVADGGDHGSNTIYKFSRTEGILSAQATVFVSGLNDPFGLAFDRNGNLFETENGSGANDGAVNLFPSQGDGNLSTNVIVFNSNLKQPTMLAFGSGILPVSAAKPRLLPLTIFGGLSGMLLLSCRISSKRISPCSGQID